MLSVSRTEGKGLVVGTLLSSCALFIFGYKYVFINFEFFWFEINFYFIFLDYSICLY